MTKTLNEVLNGNIEQMKYWYKKIEEEFLKVNPNKDRIKIDYKTFNHFFKEIEETQKAYEHLEMMDLISEKKLESIKNEIKEFKQDTFLMRSRADEIMRVLNK